MTWPASRRLTDKNGDILDPWMRQLDKLKPLLDLSVQDFATLKELVRAAQRAEVEGTSIFDVAVLENPDFAADYALIWDKSIGDGRKTPLSRFRSSLISRTELSSYASVGIFIPNTYQHVRFAIIGLSPSTSSSVDYALSEDGGGNFLTGSYLLGGSTNTDTSPLIITSASSASATHNLLIEVHNAVGSTDKIASMISVDNSGNPNFANYIFTSTNPVNFAQFAVSSGTFDAGTIELWGIP